MQILKYEKIAAAFKPWTIVYLSVAEQLVQAIRTTEIDAIHIGSTAAMIGGKGIIDISVLYGEGDFDLAIDRLRALGFQDQISQTPFPPERPRKDGTVIVGEEKYLVHVHVIQKNSEEHEKQIKFREHMLKNPEARLEYEASKKAILSEGINDQEAYGKRKSPYVKSVLSDL